jgi:crossover junction endodeoxyribonuclease RusA
MKSSTGKPRKNTGGAALARTSLETPTLRTSGFAKPKEPFARVTITIPWEHLVPDNAKYGVMRGRMLLRADYRAAKDTIQHIARRAMKDTLIAEGDVILHAKLYMPDARRRDATNYAKLVQDSIQDAVYTDDTQIKVATWENAGLDRANPRCEVTITRRAA